MVKPFDEQILHHLYNSNFEIPKPTQEVLRSPSVLRMREINQLSPVTLTTHNRDIHAKDGIFTVLAIINQLRNLGYNINTIYEILACTSIGIHDIGHYVFSHMLEAAILDRFHRPEIDPMDLLQDGVTGWVMEHDQQLLNGVSHLLPPLNGSEGRRVTPFPWDIEDAIRDSIDLFDGRLIPTYPQLILNILKGRKQKGKELSPEIAKLSLMSKTGPVCSDTIAYTARDMYELCRAGTYLPVVAEVRNLLSGLTPPQVFSVFENAYIDYDGMNFVYGSNTLFQEDVVDILVRFLEARAIMHEQVYGSPECRSVGTVINNYVSFLLETSALTREDLLTLTDVEVKDKLFQHVPDDLRQMLERNLDGFPTHERVFGLSKHEILQRYGQPIWQSASSKIHRRRGSRIKLEAQMCKRFGIPPNHLLIGPYDDTWVNPRKTERIYVLIDGSPVKLLDYDTRIQDTLDRFDKSNGIHVYASSDYAHQVSSQIIGDMILEYCGLR